jgi:hypothetical protein
MFSLSVGIIRLVVFDLFQKLDINRLYLNFNAVYLTKIKIKKVLKSLNLLSLQKYNTALILSS